MGLTTVSSVALTHGVYQNHDSLGGVRAASETTSYTAGCLAPSPRESGVPKEDPALHICRRGEGSAIYAVGRGVPPSRTVDKLCLKQAENSSFFMVGHPRETGCSQLLPAHVGEYLRPDLWSEHRTSSSFLIT